VIAAPLTLACSIDLAVTGAAVLSIPDAAGELVAYRLESAPAGLSAWAVTVTRLDSGDAYRVSLERDGSWRCGCKGFFYRGRARKGGCKHTQAARAVRGFLESHRRVNGVCIGWS
jgi:hypothetical protein